MKTNYFLIAIALLSVSLYSCDKNTGNDTEQTEDDMLYLLKTTDEGISTFDLNNVCPILDVTDPLTTDEIEYLYEVREGEKMSHDVSHTLAGMYSAINVFANFDNAEMNHIQAIETLLNYYEIEFPVLEEVGIFADEGKQALYDDIIAKSATTIEALTNIAAIEERNIAAYTSALPSIVNVNIEMLIDNLLKSSKNHLKAAVRQITMQGGSYTPTILDMELYEEIINSSFNQGDQYCRNNNGQGNGKNSGGGGKGHRNGK